MNPLKIIKPVGRPVAVGMDGAAAAGRSIRRIAHGALGAAAVIVIIAAAVVILRKKKH